MIDLTVENIAILLNYKKLYGKVDAMPWLLQVCVCLKVGFTVYGQQLGHSIL